MPGSRRAFIRNSLLLSGMAGLNLSVGSSKKSAFDQTEDKLVLLGTQGGPLIRSYKQTPSANLIMYKKTPFIIDTGYGVTLKLREQGFNLAKLRYIFITHHHSDHNLELGTLIYNAWVAGLNDTVHVYAPVGLKQLLKYFWKSNQFDIDMRIGNEGRPDIRKLVIAHEIKEGKLLSNPNEEVSALRNIHPPVTESYAFKFKLGEKIIVFSGDTTYCPSLIEFAKDAEYLIHEIMDGPAVEEMVKRRPNAPKLKESILAHHTLAADVGRIAREANVKHLILNHFVPPDDKTLTEQFWVNAVSKTYPGNIIVGKDLLEFSL